ncbi:hypothetical protein Aph01nite_43100 [Acrocarpospora phusangensis]|uniref:HTH cro/C1-type domain-containing protein n=1 Tax=Acrocarpospora phusangensis TaxID=1070424 RepID=A0A919US07_9ACTN|nr:helix-turn-helix transcriptional regulator [Acrocarpospora phusangensis]GIH26000.1 hypothetical protein Aph01nite_43100 [Acrocarpospora phusangensis]
MAATRRTRSRSLALNFDGSRARETRERQGLTIANLADRCEQAGQRIHHTTIYRWENGTFWPTAPRLKALAEALGVSIDDLLIPSGETRAESA